MNNRNILIVLLSLTFTSFAQARDIKYDLTGRWGAGIGLGGSSVSGPSAFTEGNGELDGGFVGSLWGRYHFDESLGLEASYTRLTFDYAKNIPGLNDLDTAANMFMVNGAYRFWAEEQFHLLTQAGLGLVTGSDFTVAGDNSFSKMAVSARVGGEYMATPNLMLALHLDYYSLKMGDGPATSLRLWAPMIALTYYFGGESAPAEAAPVVPAKVIKGDADGDGVLDADDKCPGSPVGEKVTEFGCAKTDKLEITLNVQFPTGSSQIDPKFTADLKKFGEFMVKYPETYVEIEGHTDNTGSEKFNYTISQKRADSVRKWILKNYKVDKKRVTSKGYGPTQPVADNTKPEGRTKNRRVVAHVQTEAPAK